MTTTMLSTLAVGWTFLLTALATTGAYAAAGNFVDISASVTPKLSNIENLYLQHTTAAGNDGVATRRLLT